MTPQTPSREKYPTRECRPPGYLKDYAQEDSDEDDSTLTSIDYCYRAVCGVPLTFQEAMASTESGKWKRAMDEEIESLEDNQTFTLTTLPEGRKAVGGRWVYSIKEGSDGHDQYKARFVAKGYSQRAGIDYGETFSPGQSDQCAWCNAKGSPIEFDIASNGRKNGLSACTHR